MAIRQQHYNICIRCNSFSSIPSRGRWSSGPKQLEKRSVGTEVDDDTVECVRPSHTLDTSIMSHPSPLLFNKNNKKKQTDFSAAHVFRNLARKTKTNVVSDSANWRTAKKQSTSKMFMEIKTKNKSILMRSWREGGRKNVSSCV